MNETDKHFSLLIFIVHAIKRSFYDDVRNVVTDIILELMH